MGHASAHNAAAPGDTTLTSAEGQLSDARMIVRGRNEKAAHSGGPPEAAAAAAAPGGRLLGSEGRKEEEGGSEEEKSKAVKGSEGEGDGHGPNDCGRGNAEGERASRDGNVEEAWQEDGLTGMDEEEERDDEASRWVCG